MNANVVVGGVVVDVDDVNVGLNVVAEVAVRPIRQTRAVVAQDRDASY